MIGCVVFTIGVLGRGFFDFSFGVAFVGILRIRVV